MFESYAKGVLGATDDIENLDRTAFTQSVLSVPFISSNFSWVVIQIKYVAVLHFGR